MTDIQFVPTEFPRCDDHSSSDYEFGYFSNQIWVRYKNAVPNDWKRLTLYFGNTEVVMFPNRIKQWFQLITGYGYDRTRGYDVYEHATDSFSRNECERLSKLISDLYNELAKHSKRIDAIDQRINGRTGTLAEDISGLKVRLESLERLRSRLALVILDATKAIK